MKRFVVVALVVMGCAKAEKPAESSGPRQVEVTASDYAFTMPDTLPAGAATFTFVNSGKVRHELNITRLKPGIPMDSLLSVLRADKSVKDLIEGAVGVLFASPGGSSSAGLSVNLKPGERYAVICVFADSSGAKQHFDMGMYKQVTVTGPAVEERPVAADTIVATEYAFQYPRTLAPGRHTFVLRNSGKQRHEFSIDLLKAGVTVDSIMSVGKKGGDVEALIDGATGILHTRAGEQNIGGLTLEMLPGREYLIACFFKDTPTSPEHVDLGMFGVIRTSAAGTTDD